MLERLLSDPLAYPRSVAVFERLYMPIRGVCGVCGVRSV
jgi:hypothetical protein